MLDADAFSLQIGDIAGEVKHGRGGFGLSLAPLKWHKAGPEPKEEAGSQDGKEGDDEV